MARYISNKFAQGNDLRVLLLSPEFEEVVRRGIRQTSGGSFINLEPAESEELMDRLSVGLDTLHIAQKDMVLLCSIDVRRYIKKLIGAVSGAGRDVVRRSLRDRFRQCHQNAVRKTCK
jgi:type III secretion protein V